VHTDKGYLPYQYIAHLRQECHNSKFGIFELLVQKKTVSRCTFNRYSVTMQFAKLATAEQLCSHCTHRKLLNSVALVRKRTIPTERPPPVCEVSANFCG